MKLIVEKFFFLSRLLFCRGHLRLESPCIQVNALYSSLDWWFPFVFLYFTAELGCIACYHNISHASIKFIRKYLKQMRTVINILHILSEAPVFTNLQVGTQVYSFISTRESSSVNPFVIINQIILLREKVFCGLWWLSCCAFNCYLVKLSGMSKVVFWLNTEFYWTILCSVKILWVMWKWFFVQKYFQLNINKKIIIYKNWVLRYHKELWTEAMESAL
jgi:hypothetical protein